MIEQQPPPTLPNYHGVSMVPNPKQQGPLMKVMGKMLASKLPRMMKGKISSQTIKVSHGKRKDNKVKYW